MSHPLPETAQQALDALLAPGERALVAVSGGADSVALLHLTHRAGRAGGVLHFDHQTRGGASAEDAAFVRDLAASLDLPFHFDSRSVAELAAAQGASFEMAARDLRYGFFEEAARTAGLSAVATGHHADDQAETVLMRLLRGASPSGLAGIPPSRNRHGVRFIRPLLECPRDTILAWLRAEGLPWREDTSNTDPRYTRNRIRHELLPLLARDYNPAIAEALQRLAQLQRQDDALLERLTDAAREQCLDATGRLLRAPFRDTDPALQYRLIAACIQEIGGDASFEGVQQAVEALQSAPAGIQIDLGHDRSLFLAADHAVMALPQQARDPLRLILPVPGVADGLGRRFQARILEARPAEPLARYCHPGRQVFDAAALGDALIIRTRRPGDRFQPLGLAGSRKLKDVFNTLGLTQPERDAQLLFESNGEIVWIPGHTISHNVAVTAATRRLLEVTVT
ncbi:MAG: tRNA lysidine(34) synthetase TilS [Candidatus Hydrogenedentes bacterium]|nr:tRNA lysidine(34) synthetase TilS [Candidatus Hydrogenedentota bacterium]